MGTGRIHLALLGVLCGACGSTSTRQAVSPIEPAPLVAPLRVEQPRPQAWPASMLILSRAETPLRRPPAVSNRERAPGRLRLLALETPVIKADPRRPSWAGLRLELGAGQAPHDDAPASNALLPEGARGFSDSLMRLVLEGQISSGVTIEGGLAATRFLDEPILDGLMGAELAWFSFGLRFRF